MLGTGDITPELNKIIKTPEAEVAEKLAAVEHTETLLDLTNKLQKVRERAALGERIKDIEFTGLMDDFVTTVLETIADNREHLKAAIVKILKAGDIKRLKELMIAVNFTLDRRETLLGFDDTRGRTGKKKLKLQVMWKGQTGEQIAAQAEVSE